MAAVNRARLGLLCTIEGMVAVEEIVGWRSRIGFWRAPRVVLRTSLLTC